MRPSRCLVALSVLAALLTAVHPSRAADEPAYQRLYPAVECFLIDDAGTGFELTVDVKDRNLYAGPCELLVKVYDPDGKAVVRSEVEDKVTSGIYPSSATELDYYDQALRRGVPPLMRWTGLSDTLDGVVAHSKAFTVPANGKGVYRVMLAGTESQWVRVRTSRAMRRGILADPNWLHGHDKQAHTRYVFIPPGTQAFHLYLMELDRPQTRTLRLVDEDDRVLVDMTPEPDQGSLIRIAELPTKEYAAGEDHLSKRVSDQVHRNENDHIMTPYLFRAPKRSLDGQVLRLEISAGEGDYLLSFVVDHRDVRRPFAGQSALADGATGPTAVFCDSDTDARAIKGGHEAWRDGTAIWHGYQRRAREYIATIKPADLVLKTPDGKPLGWKSPGNQEVIYDVLPWGYNRPDLLLTLADEVNTIIAGLDDPDSIDELVAKLPLNDVHMRALVLAYTQPFEGNDYYKHPAALKLVTVALLSRLTRAIALGDRPAHSRPACCPTYGVCYGFHCYDVALWLRDLVNPTARDIIAEGMTTVADRAAYLYTVSHNSATHVPLILHQVAAMTGDKHSKMLADRYLTRWLDATLGWDMGVTPSGDVAEYLGHGQQYAGYHWAPIARLYLLTKDQRVLDLIKRGFHLNTHTSLPGIRRSSNSWSSRTSGVYQDWASACVYVPEIVPESALLAPAAPTGMIRTAPPPMVEGKEPLISPPGITFAYVDRRDLQLPPWPMDREANFTRDLNGGHEWFAVKRDNYYALVFAGRLAPTFWNDVWRGYCGFTGGTLCTLYRPRKGPVIVSKKTGSAYYGEAYGKWRDTVCHDVVGEMADGREIRIGDSRARASMDDNTLTVHGTCRNVPLKFARIYTFHDSAIDVSIDVDAIPVGMNMLHHNPDKPQIKTLQEVIPFEDHETGIEAFDADGKSLGKAGDEWLEGVTSVRIGKVGEGCTVTFEQSQAVRVGNSLWVRIVGEPTGPDEDIAPLRYRIDVPE